MSTKYTDTQSEEIHGLYELCIKKHEYTTYFHDKLARLETEKWNEELQKDLTCIKEEKRELYRKKFIELLFVYIKAGTFISFEEANSIGKNMKVKANADKALKNMNMWRHYNITIS